MNPRGIQSPEKALMAIPPMILGKKEFFLTQREFVIEYFMDFMNLIPGTTSGIQILTLTLNSFSKICSRRYLLMSIRLLVGGNDGEFKRIDLSTKRETSVPEFLEKYLASARSKTNECKQNRPNNPNNNKLGYN